MIINIKINKTTILIINHHLIRIKIINHNNGVKHVNLNSILIKIKIINQQNNQYCINQKKLIPNKLNNCIIKKLIEIIIKMII